MSGFDESKVRRGQPQNAGQFAQKRTSAPSGALTGGDPPRTSSVVLTGVTTTHIGRTVHQVAAAKDLPQHGVKAGDVGGFVESLELADGSPRISDDAWLGAEAVAIDQASVRGEAIVVGEVNLEENAIVRDRARVEGGRNGIGRYVDISGDATVAGDAHVQQGSIIGGRAVVGGDARLVRGNVFDDAVITGGTLHGQSTLDGQAVMSSGYVTMLARVSGTAEVVGDVVGGTHTEGIVGGGVYGGNSVLGNR